MFDRFEKKVFIEGTLRCTTAIRIGVGRSTLDAGGSDLPVLRSASGSPLLPGASLKGVVRSALESILRGSVSDAAISRVACDRAIRPCVLDKAPKEDENEEAPEQARRHRARIQTGLCCICSTFGAPGLASHVVFRDASASADALVEQRDGVAIDRDLGRVSGARKYDFEVVAAGATFPFALTIDSAKDWQEGLVVVGVELLAQGMIRVGGMSSRGLGQVELTDLAVKVLDRETALAGAKPEVRDWGAFSQAARGAWVQHWTERRRTLPTEVEA